MPTTLSRLISAIRDLCGKPSREALGDDQILDAIYNEQTEINNALNLSSQNRLVERVEFALTDQEMTIPVSDFDVAERVYIIGDADTRWLPLDVVNLEQLPGALDTGAVSYNTYASAVSFVGGRMRFDGVPANARVQLWYKPTYSEPESTADNLRGVPDGDVPLLKVRAAAFLRENFLGLPVTLTMRQQIDRLERQFKRRATRSSESGLVKKSRFRAGAGGGVRLLPGPGRYRLG